MRNGTDPVHPGAFLSQSVEVDPAGKILYNIQFTGMEYRTFRMGTLYTAP